MEFTYNFRCCICGVSMKERTTSNQCVQCLQQDVDLSIGVTADHVNFCKRCERYESVKKKWRPCEWDSRDLLALVLKLVKGVGKKERPEIIDAIFIYSEPHSKRIRVKLQLEKEIATGAILRQTHAVEFVIKGLQCVDCERDFTPHTWNTVVQVRQRSEQKRTFHHLEDLLTKNRSLEKLLKIEHHEDGIDFFFNGPSEATPKLVEYLKSWVVGKEKHSKHMVSNNVNNSTAKFKRAYYIELCPLSRGDLVCLPKKVAKAMSSPQVLLVLRVRSNIQLVDPKSGKYFLVSRDEYWRNPFLALVSSKQLREFVVMDDSDFPNVTVAQASELGAIDDCLVESRAHFQMEVCDEVLAYDLADCVVPGLDEVDEDDRPDVVLVERKHGKTVLIARDGQPLRARKAPFAANPHKGNVKSADGLDDAPDDAEIPAEEIADWVKIISAPETAPVRDDGSE